MMLQVEKDGFQTAVCKLCGQKIVWAYGKGDCKKIPLDPKAPVYYVEMGDPTGPEKLKNLTVAKQMKGNPFSVHRYPERTRFLVNHFATCPAKQKSWKLLEEIYDVLHSRHLGVPPHPDPTDVSAVRVFAQIRTYLGKE
jgi:hypothetical protein